MIKQITRTYNLSSTEQNTLKSLSPFQPGVWDSSIVKDIKTKIHNQLLTIQDNNCCYCGLKVNEGGRAEIEHIANKGGKKKPAYTEFVFTKKNLAIVCQFCNSSSKKGQVDTLDNVDLTNYDNCTFKIVHPYFDNPNLHYSWSKGTYKILISHISDEGEESIKLFGLDSEAHTMARAKQVMFEEKLSKYNKRQEIKNRVMNILKKIW
jgi:uncharacterized protein (TIGR02646 family)